MGFANRATLAAVLGFSAAALAGCGGGGGLLTRSESNQLDTQLGNASSALSAGNCNGAAVALDSFTNSVESLQTVNATLLSNLDRGAHKILALALAECHGRTVKHTQTGTTSTSTNTTPTVTTPITTTTSTITTNTVTAPLDTTPATTTPTTPATTTPTTPATTTPTTASPPSGGNGLFSGSTGNTGTG